jgi:murein DD-endopeptidase MepM/ murein hydrolase activator NlpD
MVLAAPSWAQNAANDVAASKEEADDTYTVQSGDTLSRISRRFGIPANALVRANDLPHPDRLTAGHVLRLPVTSPRPPAVKPSQEQAPPTPQPQPAQAQPPQAQPAQAQSASGQPVEAPLKPAASRAQPAAKAAAPTGTGVETAPPPEAPSPSRAEGIGQQAAGLYKHQTLGSLRLSEGPDGVILAKNNQNIALRRLLYAVYDGTDATGNVHTVDLVFDAGGHVTALRYSAGGTGQVTFERAGK